MMISQVKSELAAAVRAKGIPNLDCYQFMPANPMLPCFIAGEVSIAPNNTFGGCDVAMVTCTVFVSTADDQDGQLLLDQLLSRSGTYSVRAALLAARGAPGQLALNGAADDLSIADVNGYGMIQVGNNDAYYGANIMVRVMGS